MNEETHRRIPPGGHVVSPLLLAASTLLAGVFCYLYLSLKYQEPQPRAPMQAATATSPATASRPVLPERDRPEAVSGFENTSLQVEHVLEAAGPGGSLGRILLEVPVVHRSGKLHWTAKDAQEARALFNRMVTHLSKVQALREEGQALLVDWDELVTKGVPAAFLRADSPSLPANQAVADQPGRPTAESVTLETPQR
jgi:hypothetical protein